MCFDEVKLRAQTLLCALGDGPVAKALTAVNPWRELKWLANQQRPPFLIVKPSELNEKVKQRQGKGSVGQKSHKHAKGKGKAQSQGLCRPWILLDFAWNLVCFRALMGPRLLRCLCPKLHRMSLELC